MALDAATQTALNRLKNLYDGTLPYNPQTNPGGFRVGGHRVNFVPALQDAATAVLGAATLLDQAIAAGSGVAQAAANLQQKIDQALAAYGSTQALTDAVTAAKTSEDRAKTSADQAAASASSVLTAAPEIPPALQTFMPAPPSILAPGSTYPISWFGDGVAQMLRDPSVRDMRGSLLAAARSGQKVGFPAELYPIRSGAVTVDEDTPIHWDGATGATIVPGKEIPVVSGCVINLKAKNLPSTRNRVPLTMQGFRWDATEITQAKGKGSGSGLGFLDYSWYTNVLLENHVAFCGRTGLTDTDRIGVGFIDSAFNSHAVLNAIYRDISVEGAYDLAGYFSGSQVRRTVSNPFTTQADSPVVTVSLPAHGFSTGQGVGVTGATPVGGLTLSGGYVVTVVNADTFTITAASNATSGATGGGSVTLYNDVADQMGDQEGEQETCENWQIYRCTNALSFKRNTQGSLAWNIYALECGNGVRCANVGGPTFGGRLRVQASTFRRITGIPVQLVGYDCEATGCSIQDFGSELDGSARTDHSVNTIVAGIVALSAIAPVISGNVVRQRGLWRTGSAVPELAGKERRAVALLKSSEYPYGTLRAKVFANDFDGVFQGVLEGPGCDLNRSVDNTETGVPTASAKTAASSSVIGGKSLVVGDTGTIPPVTADPTAHIQPAFFSAPADTGRAAWSARATAKSGRTIGAIQDPDGVIWRLVTNNGETYVQSGPAGSLSNSFVFGLSGLRLFQNLTPNADGGANLGSATAKFATGFFNNLRFGTFTANADAAVNGYVTITDAAGNTRKLATIA